MVEAKTMRLNKVLREFNISLDRAVEHLSSHGYEVEARPTSKITQEEYQSLLEEFQTDKSKKVESKEVGEEKRKEKEELRIEREKEIEGGFTYNINTHTPTTSTIQQFPHHSHQQSNIILHYSHSYVMGNFVLSR